MEDDSLIFGGTPSCYRITFSSEEGEEIGRLEFIGKEIKFTGNTDEAAKVFFNYFLKNLCDGYLANPNNE